MKTVAFPAPAGEEESAPTSSPAARWSSLVLAFDEKTLSAILQRLTRNIDEVEGIAVRVSPGDLEITVSIRKFGLPIPARARLSEVRFRDGFLAFVLEGVEALSFIPIPDSVIARLVERAPAGLVTFYRQDRILVINLGPWLPVGLDLELDSAEFADGEARLNFGAGRLDLRSLLSDDD